MNGERSRIRGELAIGRGSSRHTPVFGGSAADPNHDAVIRIGGEAPGRQADSKPRSEDHVQYRVAATSDRHLQSVISSWRIAENLVLAGMPSRGRAKGQA